MKTISFKIIAGIVVIILLIIGIKLIGSRDAEDSKGTSGSVASSVSDISNLSYTIDEETIKLSKGIHEEKIENSAAIERTEIIKSATGELNNDAIADAAVILVQSGGGTGIFYSLAAAYSAGTETRTTPAVFLGDRIVMKGVSIGTSGKIIVTYLDRQEDDPMTAEPTVTVTKTFTLKSKELIEQ